MTTHRDEDAPAKIGKYRVLGPLGEGGMSVVYRARDEALDRAVALKLLHRHLARDPEARARFTREARAVARLTHRNIPEIYDFSGAGAASDDAGGRAYIVSELVDGAPLSRLLQGAVALPEIGVAIVMGVGHALSHAHGHQVVHRDVKPENVLVGKDGVVKLTDFGIAQVRGVESMTMTGTLIGSPAHMAPEQIDGTKDLDARVDVWGFGTVLYMVATNGRLPFEADNAHHLLRKVVSGEYTDPRRLSQHVDAELTKIIARCLTVDRAARYPDIDAVMRDLGAWLAVRELGPPEALVKAFMADPPGYTRLLGETLESTFMRLGDEASAKGDVSLALERYGRILALDPDHDVALDRVRKLERRLRTKKRMAWGAGGLVVAGGALALIVAMRPGPTPPWSGGATLTRMAMVPSRPTLEPAKVVPPVEVAVGRAVSGAWGADFGAALDLEAGRFARAAQRAEELAKSDGDKAEHDKAEHDKGDKKPHQALVPVTLTAYPPAVTIAVAGRSGRGPLTVDLAPGRYQVVLTHPTRPDFAPDSRWLVVPETHGEAFAPETFSFVQRPAANETTTLFVRCRDGKDGYAKDLATGKHYACDMKHTLPVEPGRARTMTLAFIDKDGNQVDTKLFNVNATQSIIW